MCSATCLAAWVLQDEGHLGDHQQHVWQHGFCKMKGALKTISNMFGSMGFAR
jgi:hypothetical protein